MKPLIKNSPLLIVILMLIFSAPLSIAEAAASTYTVTYELGGGTGSVPVDSNIYNTGDTVTVLFSPLPTRPGYTFIGWTNGWNDDSITFTSSGTTTFAMGIDNVVLTAVWQHFTLFYTKPAASGAGDCSTWANACTLQTALAAVLPGDQIWVAAGTHKPGAARLNTFQLASDVTVYGGFAGTETLLSQRDPDSNPTILSGDVNGDDSGFTNNAENNYHVVSTAPNTLLDGFVVTAGNADGVDLDGYGGGVYNESNNVALANLTIHTNSANGGGGIYNNNASATLTNVAIVGNSSSTSSGGAGMRNNNSTLTLTNMVMSGNRAANLTQGGAMYNTGSTLTLTNVTISGNSAGNGGGIMNDGSTTIQMRNSILWDNAGGDMPSGGTVTGSYNIAPAAAPLVGSNNYDVDPNFVTPVTDPAPTTTGNLRLQAGSPAINAGNSGVSNPYLPPTDLDGNVRIQKGAVDLGAYESALAVVTFVANGGTGTMASQSSSVAANLSSNLFTRAGYSFTGWNTLANGSGMAYANGASYSFTQNVTLYAQWAIIDYAVTYALGGGTGSVPTDNNTYNIGNTVTVLFSPLPTRTGYTFAGWSDGVTTYTSGGTNSFTMGSSNITLTAQWTINVYTVAFHANGGTGSMSSQSGNYNTTVVLPNNTFTRTGYIFAGWNTQANAGGTSYANGANYTFVASITLYAQWALPFAPDTTITSKSVPVITQSKSVTFGFTSSQANSTFECAITYQGGDLPASEAGGWETCSSPVSYSNLWVGKYTFMVRAKNAIGLTDSTPAIYNWTIRRERISNRSFEIYYTNNSLIPGGWQASGFLAGDGKSLLNVKDGIASLRLGGGSTVKTLKQQMINVAGGIGAPIHFSFWVMGTSIPATAGVCQGVLEFYSGTTQVATKSLNCPVGSYGYQQLAVNFTVPAAFDRAIVKFVYSKATGSILFDLVSFLK